MKKQPVLHRYPHTLLDLNGLSGGSYGRLSLTVVDRQTAELRLGSDFVRLTPTIARKVEDALMRFAPPEGLHIEEEVRVDEGDEEVVVRIKEDVRPLPRKRSTRPRPPTI